MPHTIKKMSLIGLILMIFTSVFGFANSPSAYYLMGYSAIPFYIFSALLFFIPFALMMAEMGAAYRKEEGGIYSWMNNSVGPRFAFIGTFMWFSSYIIWMVSTSAKVWVPFSTFLYGSDMTQHWRIAGLEPTQVVGLLAVAWMILVTVVASKGINKIARITAVGGIAVMCLNLVLLLVSITILLLNGGHFAQDSLHHRTQVISPVWQCYRLWYLLFLPMAELKRLVVWSIKRKIQKRTLPKVLFLPLLLFQSVIRWQYFYGVSAQTGSRY